MNEFLKLSWRIKSCSEIDPGLCFISKEVIADSYVYKNFTNPIKSKPKGTIKLRLPTEKYVPGKKHYRPIPQRSLLTKLQKNHCLIALKLFQSGKNQDALTTSEKYSIQIFTECQSKIVAENRRFLEYTRNAWNRSKERVQKMKPGLLNYSWYHWKRRIGRYLEYPQFYREIGLIGLNYDENEATLTCDQTMNILELGVLPRFSPPSLKEQCLLKIVTLPKIDDKISLNSKLPVSQDQNITKLHENYQFDVVISSNGLKQIIDYTNTKSKWIIPVVVKEVAQDKKIVFIDKALPKTNPNCHDLKYYAYKQLLKANFCQYVAFSFINVETPINPNDVTEEEEDGQDDVDEENVPKKNGKIHHNVSYRIWSIKKSDNQTTLMKNKVKDKEIKLLVRSKIDACECTEQGALLPIVIKPKIEQQLQYGANITSKSELAREWTSLFFRIFSNLYRARLFSPMSEIIAVEKCSIQKINSEAFTHYNYKPILGLGVLQKVIEELMNLECGNYLLYHLPKHESFLSLMKQCDENAPNRFDLHKESEACRIDSETKQNWLPIDVNYILPVHEEYNQIPATFQGFDRINPAGKKKKGSKNKKKTKAKTRGKTQEKQS